MYKTSSPTLVFRPAVIASWFFNQTLSIYVMESSDFFLSQAKLVSSVKKRNQFTILLIQFLPRLAIANKRFSFCYKLAQH